MENFTFTTKMEILESREREREKQRNVYLKIGKKKKFNRSKLNEKILKKSEKKKEKPRKEKPRILFTFGHVLVQFIIVWHR